MMWNSPEILQAETFVQKVPAVNFADEVDAGEFVPASPNSTNHKKFAYHIQPYTPAVPEVELLLSQLHP